MESLEEQVHHLRGLVLTLDERLLNSYRRIAALEADRDRFLQALKGAAKMCLQNPVVRSMAPKEVIANLEALRDSNDAA